MAYLLDTNVISELGKKSPDPKVAAWIARAENAGAYLSVLVVGEVRRGVELMRRRDQHQADRLDLWLDTLYRSYAERIVPVTVWG